MPRASRRARGCLQARRAAVRLRRYRPCAWNIPIDVARDELGERRVEARGVVDVDFLLALAAQYLERLFGFDERRKGPHESRRTFLAQHQLKSVGELAAGRPATLTLEVVGIGVGSRRSRAGKFAVQVGPVLH